MLANSSDLQRWSPDLYKLHTQETFPTQDGFLGAVGFGSVLFSADC